LKPVVCNTCRLELPAATARIRKVDPALCVKNEEAVDKGVVESVVGL